MSFTENYKNGVDNYYKNIGNSYINPHQDIIQFLVRSKCSHHKTVLDLAAGTGEVTLSLPNTKVTGVEPFLFSNYSKNTNCVCYPLTFEEIAEGKLKGNWDAAICSFALHLLKESWLPKLLYALGDITSNFYILSPHKKPYIDNFMWELKEHFIVNRVHFRHYALIC
jgi:hypothetical protein